MAQIEESVARYLQQLDTADRQEPSEALKTKTSLLKEKIEKLNPGLCRLQIQTRCLVVRPACRWHSYRGTWIDAPFNHNGSEPTADDWSQHWETCCQEAAAANARL